MSTSAEKLEAIKRFRVERAGGDTCLVTGVAERVEFPLRVTGVHLSVSGRLCYAGRSRTPHSSTRWLTANDLTVSVGAPGQEGYHSALADDTLFVLHNSQIRYLPLNEIGLVPLDELNHAQPEAVTSAASDEDSKWLGRALLSHTPATRGLWGESIECVIGLPEPHFTELLGEYMARRANRIVVGAMVRAHSSGAFFESARDLILLANETTTGVVHEVSISLATGPRGASPTGEDGHDSREADETQ